MAFNFPTLPDMYTGPYTAIAALACLLIVYSILPITKLIVRFASVRRLARTDMSVLELTPSAANDTALATTASLFSVLHGLQETRSIIHKLVGRPVVFTFEIVSTREEGIRFLARVPTANVQSFKRTLITYTPGIRVEEVSDYFLNSPADSSSSVVEYKQSGYFAYPLQANNSLIQFDPVTYLAGAMTQLATGELMALQLVLEPVNLRSTKAIIDKMLHNEEQLRDLGKPSSATSAVLRMISKVLFLILDCIASITHGPSNAATQRPNASQRQSAAGLRPARSLSALEQKLADSVSEKLSQPLFNVSIRSFVQCANPLSARERSNELRQVLGSLSTPQQSLKSNSTLITILTKRYLSYAVEHRLPTLRNHNTILSSSELAVLYHFPHANAVSVENVVRSFSTVLPTPLLIKQNADNQKFDVVIGRNYYHGSETNIGLTERERERHVYIIGGTGNGKTTMLQYAIVQDMQSGKGLAVIDPHGDMAEAILRYVPQHRVQDVIYFNPDDLDYPIGLNLLEIKSGLSGTELMREKDIITESVVSVFRKIFSDEDNGGHRIEYILRNAVQTALTVEGATLFTIFNLLNDPKYRRKIVDSLENEDLKNFWRHELGKAGDMQRVKMSAGITAKIGRFLFSASAKQILEQPKSTIDFDDIINSGKILICNFSKGLLGEDTSELFGVMVLAKLQLAALRRTRIQQAERQPFYIYVDEFQNFATPSFVQMFSEARKYKLFMMIAEQSTSQQNDRQMVNIILANVGTVICFRTGNPQDERLILPLFTPFIKSGEISNLPSFTFYARLSAQQAQEPTSGMTLQLSVDDISNVSDCIIETSRMRYALAQKPMPHTTQPADTAEELKIKKIDSSVIDTKDKGREMPTATSQDSLIRQ